MVFFLFGCESIFFWPSKDLVDSPTQFGFEREIVLFESFDQQQLHGWYLKARNIEQHNANGTIFFLHGNAQNLSFHIANLYWLIDHGWNVFIIDYRGYGRSQGTPSFKTVIDDAAAGYQWLEANGDTNIIVFGQSLGGSIGLGMLGVYPDININGLILDSTFASHQDVLQDMFAKSWLFWAFQYPLSRLVSDDYAPEKFTPFVNVPTLVVHSTDDNLIDKKHSEQLYQQLNAPKALWLVNDANHIAIWQHQQWQQRLICQLQQWPNLQTLDQACTG